MNLPELLAPAGDRASFNAEYEAFAQKFTNENNQFQKYDEKYGRHQIVDEMIENYRKQLKEKQQ